MSCKQFRAAANFCRQHSINVKFISIAHDGSFFEPGKLFSQLSRSTSDDEEKTSAKKKKFKRCRKKTYANNKSNRLNKRNVCFGVWHALACWRRQVASAATTFGTATTKRSCVIRRHYVDIWPTGTSEKTLQPKCHAGLYNNNQLWTAAALWRRAYSIRQSTLSLFERDDSIYGWCGT